MSNVVLYRWDGNKLVTVDSDDTGGDRIEAVESFLVSEGRAFALQLHLERFRSTTEHLWGELDCFSLLNLESFWKAALCLIPEEGSWFPRVEFQSKGAAMHLFYRHRPAPNLSRSAVLTTLGRPDPRDVPGIKGPDIEALLKVRAAARRRGADDAVILTPDGYVVDGTTSAIVWWRDDILCAPPAAEDSPEFVRVDSVTAKSLFGLARAFDIETHRERVTPAELGGCEVWALSALQGIRIVTAWVDGPDLAERPGRLSLWRNRRDALCKPIGVLAT